MTTFLIIVLVLVCSVIGWVIWNLNRKLTVQEDIISGQVDYLRNVSYLIQESKLYIDRLDEKGVFRSDDEIGTFFKFMKEVQENINQFRLPENYGKPKT